MRVLYLTELLSVFPGSRRVFPVDNGELSGKLMFDFSGEGAKGMIRQSRVWKDGMRRGIAYVEGRETAEQVRSALGKEDLAAGRRIGRDDALTGIAMAVYLDNRGRPFAWQFTFDIALWERVAALVEGAVPAS